MGPVAELAGSPALVALSPSALSLLPVSFPAQIGSDLQLLPLAEGVWAWAVTMTRVSPSWSSPTLGARNRDIKGTDAGEGGVAVQGEGEGCCKVPTWVFLTLSVVWIPAGQLTKHRDCLIWQLNLNRNKAQFELP